MTRLVVKQSKKKEDDVILDFYVDAYPKQFDKIQNGFLSEVKKVKETGCRTYTFDFGKVAFTTFHAYKQEDMKRFEFDKIVFLNKIIEFDGHYVIRFKAHVLVGGRDLTIDYFNKEMADKYARKEAKQGNGGTFDLSKNVSYEKKEYTCEMCGKKIEFDEKKLLYARPEQARYITDDNGNETEGKDEGILEYYDAQIAHVTYGKWLCKDCLKKYKDQLKYGLHLD